MQTWDNYFVASAAASATLTGLIFVGLSFNLQKILSVDPLPRRALSSLLLLMNILLVSSFNLIPEQSTHQLGIELMIMESILWLFNSRMDLLMLRRNEKQYRQYNVQNAILSQVAMIPFLVGSIYLVTGNPIGLYWFVPGMIMSYIKGFIDAWVLLIEIHR